MEDLNNEYYMLYPDNNPNYPMIIASLRPNSIESYVTGKYNLAILRDDPMPKKPQYVDYHSSGSTPVISKKFVDALSELNIYRVQTLKGTTGDVIEELKLDYYMLHVFNFINAIDIEKSVVDLSSNSKRVVDVESYSLDSEKLSKIPIEKRLVFILDEYPVFYLFHQTVVDHLEQYDLKGHRFIPVSKWNDDAHFD
ncbi:hypothetical protein [Bacterioplanoides sp.]|uniref:hypothetical protein n=1 Tax=Bacterioplanoides sp. TaxID=2066072 RepID=UPI003B00025E